MKGNFESDASTLNTVSEEGATVEGNERSTVGRYLSFLGEYNFCEEISGSQGGPESEKLQQQIEEQRQQSQKFDKDFEVLQQGLKDLHNALGIGDDTKPSQKD
jgi:hypothetical protein